LQKSNNINPNLQEDSLNWQQELQHLKQNDYLKSLNKDLEESKSKGSNIYEKLYQEGNIKNKIKNEVHHTVENQKYKSEEELNKWKQSLNSVSSMNVCNRLYTLGKRRLELKEFHVRQKQQEQIKAEDRECHFRPNLSLTDQKSHKILKERNNKDTGYDRLMQWKKMKENKISQSNLNLNSEIKNMHKPEINKTSQIIISRTQAEVNRTIGRDEDAPFNRHEQLY